MIFKINLDIQLNAAELAVVKRNHAERKKHHEKWTLEDEVKMSIRRALTLYLKGDRGNGNF